MHWPLFRACARRPGARKQCNWYLTRVSQSRSFCANDPRSVVLLTYSCMSGISNRCNHVLNGWVVIVGLPDHLAAINLNRQLAVVSVDQLNSEARFMTQSSR